MKYSVQSFNNGMDIPLGDRTLTIAPGIYSVPQVVEKLNQQAGYEVFEVVELEDGMQAIFGNRPAEPAPDSDPGAPVAPTILKATRLLRSARNDSHAGCDAPREWENRIARGVFSTDAVRSHRAQGQHILLY